MTRVAENSILSNDRGDATTAGANRALDSAPWVCGIGMFIVYLFTLAPSVVHIDSGELATVQATLGIAHPTGYPLFTLLGHAFLWLPLPGSVIYRLNMLCAVWCAGGVVFMVMTLRLVLANPGRFHFGKRSQNRGTTPAVVWRSVVALIGGGLLLGFSKTYWLQSTSVEVYSLHVFLLSAICWSTTSAYMASDAHGVWSPSARRWWYLSGVVVSLGFCNHMSTVFFAPFVAYAFIAAHGITGRTVARFGLLLLLGAVIAAALYSYIPLRANSEETKLVWGLPTTLTTLWWHITGVQYSGLMFNSGELAVYNLGNLGRSLLYEFAFGGTILCLIGGIYLWQRARHLFLMLLGSALFNCVMAVNYSIRDIYTYYLLTYMVLALFGGVGIYALLQWTAGWKILSAVVVVSIVAILSVQGALNSRVSHRNLYTYEDYSKALLESVEPDAVIFGSVNSDWDIFVSQSIYYQYVEGLRTDVVVLEGGLLRSDWFYVQVEREHPHFFDNVSLPRAFFVAQHQNILSTRDKAAEPAWRGAYSALLQAMIEENIGKRPVYFSSGFIQNELKNEGIVIPKGYTIIPDRLLFRIEHEAAYRPLSGIDFRLRLPRYRNAYIRSIEVQIANVMSTRALSYEVWYKHKKESENIMKLLTSLCPDVTLPSPSYQ